MSVDEHMLMFYVIYFKRISFFVYLSVLKLFDYTKTFLMPKNLSNPSALKPVLIFFAKGIRAELLMRYFFLYRYSININLFYPFITVHKL